MKIWWHTRYLARLSDKGLEFSVNGNKFYLSPEGINCEAWNGRIDAEGNQIRAASG
ncbi:MAG TPA: hypothetical protein VK308_13840 [Pyrinomonadaceae bacterium]|nr:hypothetical protein [Pyrinomonadaceae bacterium]